MATSCELKRTPLRNKTPGNEATYNTPERPTTYSRIPTPGFLLPDSYSRRPTSYTPRAVALTTAFDLIMRRLPRKSQGAEQIKEKNYTQNYFLANLRMIMPNA
jgi:hypothetical protein